MATTIPFLKIHDCSVVCIGHRPASILVVLRDLVVVCTASRQRLETVGLSPSDWCFPSCRPGQRRISEVEHHGHPVASARFIAC